MRTVKSLAEATKLAAQSGASLEVGGRVINAGQTRLSVLRRPEPTPAPPPVVEAPKPDPFDRMAELVELQARMAAAQGQAMTAALSDIVDRLGSQQQAKTKTRRKPVSFAVERDPVTGLASRLVPTYAEVAHAGKPVEFDVERDADGRALRLIPIYNRSNP